MVCSRRSSKSRDLRGVEARRSGSPCLCAWFGACPRILTTASFYHRRARAIPAGVFAFAAIVETFLRASPGRAPVEPSIWPRTTAHRARDNGCFFLFVKFSCSSSTMIKPSGVTGAKMAERAPVTIRARPWRILCHSSWRSPADKWLCSTATSVCRCPERPKACLE